jgi:uncharacterized protein YlxW (UPF0749 family)
MGDPQALQQALDASRTVGIYREYVDALGLGYDVKTLPDVTFPAYAGSTALQYARAGA